MMTRSLSISRAFTLSACASVLMFPALTGSAAYAENSDIHAAKYMGTGTCSSSNCHGGTAPRKASDVLQDEYTTWYKHDHHSKAFQVLQNDVSKKMGEHLGITPEKDPLCLKCHATYVPDSELKGEKFVLEDGVSCESCHGPAEHWLKSHSAEGVTHEENVKNGLRELVPLDKRSELCLSCHYGTDDKFVSHNIYGAGHPRISFEMDTFSVIQPKHWKVDDDYIKRKAPYVSAKAWLNGQVISSREVMAALLSPKRSRNGLFPELTLFDCYSCHHSLGDEQFKSREYDGKPGELRLNLVSLIIIREALATINPGLSKKLGGLAEALHRNYNLGNSLDTVRKTRDLLGGDITRAVNDFEYSEENLRKLLRHLAGFASTYPYLKYETAEQLAMAMASILASEPKLSKALETNLDGVYRTLKSATEFNPAPFKAECAKFKKSV